jgi:hypothetical protein
MRRRGSAQIPLTGSLLHTTNVVSERLLIKTMCDLHHTVEQFRPGVIAGKRSCGSGAPARQTGSIDLTRPPSFLECQVLLIE